MKALFESNFQFPKQTAFYRGKVRDVYTIDNNYVVMIASDRISAFDVILPKAIPFKGQVLNQIAKFFLEQTKALVPNWLIESPHPYVSIGTLCNPYKVEMVIRGYLAGHASREYAQGKRVLCGEPMPDGMKESQIFPSPIITPATKAEEGHDEDISKSDLLTQQIVKENEYVQLEKYTKDLFRFGSEFAQKQDLLLVDTKYEFGKDKDGIIRLIDEVHTPDSSRYYYKQGYKGRLAAGENQRQLSKEFVREWLIAQDFMGKENQVMPEMPDNFVQEVSERYIELFEKITGTKFQPVSQETLNQDIEQAVLASLKRLG